MRYESLREMVVEVTRQPSRQPKIAMYAGTKLATSTLLSRRVVELLARPEDWGVAARLHAGLARAAARGEPAAAAGAVLAETFPRAELQHLCLYGFAGRNAHQTLGLLLTRRMEVAGLDPMGFVANDYALLIWGLGEVADPGALLDPEGCARGSRAGSARNAVMKRTFRNAATVAGLIEKNLPGARKSGRQATFSSDILYDTLRKYDPGHLMLRITRDEAGRGLVDFGRIEEMLARSRGRLDHVRAPHVTPLAAPLFLEMGRVPIRGPGRGAPRRRGGRAPCCARPASRAERVAGGWDDPETIAWQTSGTVQREPRHWSRHPRARRAVSLTRTQKETTR